MNSTLNKWDVGSQQIEVNDEDLDISFRVLIQYPAEPSQLLKIGPYTMDMSENAGIIPEKFPLVLLSHGNGGSHFIYHTITTYIVKNGYIVAMVEHYGNNRNDNHLENSAENFVNRPRHIKQPSISYFRPTVLEKTSMIQNRCHWSFHGRIYRFSTSWRHST